MSPLDNYNLKPIPIIYNSIIYYKAGKSLGKWLSPYFSRIPVLSQTLSGHKITGFDRKEK
ncbi:MAG: hypothetical protein WBN63_12050 [Eudoraea sp.]|uniref:hypothetical protein n=1 Tax=Eudoraea sp. TaxID=1979955 RepID=UPI003C766D28